jgi:hypothetical protein
MELEKRSEPVGSYAIGSKTVAKKTIDHFNHYEAEAARRRAERCSVENSSRGVGVGDCSCINTSYSQF